MPIWKPNPGPQEEVLTRNEFEILYGGQRGGGKTDAGVIWMTGDEFEPGKLYVDHPRFRGLVIRKNADDLGDWVDRATRLFSSWGVKPAYRPAIFVFPSGAKIKTGHLKDESAYTKYQGQEFQRMIIEELTQIPEEKRYMQLLSSCRSSVPELRPQIFLTTNPGGVGHGWVKKRFIDPMPPRIPFTFSVTLPDGREIKQKRIFIPARLEDNPHLMDNDPTYVATLEMLKDTDYDLYRAWRMGDWDVFAGQFFREFNRGIHVVKQFKPKAELTRIAGLDWGRTDPFAFLAAIVYPVYYTDPVSQQEYRFYRVVIYQEAYGTEKRPSEWGEIIERKVTLDDPKLQWIQCDNQIFNPQNDGSMSIFEQFCKYNEEFRHLMKAASKERVGGWENIHNWLSVAPDGLPYLLIMDNCINLIETLPGLVHDEVDVEDVDTEGVDHAPDALRYMLKALKWIDARVGAIKRRGVYERQVKMIKAPVIDLDLDAFAKAKPE